MAIQVQGNGGTVAEVDPTHRAVRVTSRPVDHGALGHFTYGGFTGVLGAGLAANSAIFQFRWVNASNYAVIRKVRISACVSTTFFGAGVPVQVDMVKIGSWTVAGTGGTAIAPAALLRQQVSMGNSLVQTGDMRIATTAALGAGTSTIETLARATINGPGPTAAPGTIFPPGTVLYEAQPGHGAFPLVLGANEGFSVRSVAVPATGTWQAAISIEWAEVASY